jgi:hypothetical protein
LNSFFSARSTDGMSAMVIMMSDLSKTHHKVAVPHNLVIV